MTDQRDRIAAVLSGAARRADASMTAAGPTQSLASARLTVNVGAIAENWRSLAAMAPQAETAAVVKANAYGIGMAEAVATLVAAGCRTFFVATAEEGSALRSLAPTATAYVLNGLAPGAARAYSEASLRPVLGSREEIEEWAAWRRSGGKGEAAVHVDTGMNRLGLSRDEAEALIADRPLMAIVAPSLLMSHLACADTPDNPLNARQLGLFRGFSVRFAGAKASLANSAGIHLGPDYHFQVTRPGIMLYGGRGPTARPPLKPVATAEARVLRVRDAPAGATVGYGAAQKLARESRLATLGAGYADGYHRLAGSSNERHGAEVFIRGRRAPLVGRVSMDLMVADVTAIPGVQAGDWAELFGPNIPVDEAAGHAGTIAYELLTGLGQRYARRYVGALPL